MAPHRVRAPVSPDPSQRPPARFADAEPILTTSLADEIAFRVESAILDGLYPPGSRLPQDELCERFAVSRTPVREALRKLQAKNLVLVVPNKGATVRLLSRKELMDIYDVRSLLESRACELAAERATDRVVTSLDHAQEQLSRLIEALDARRGDEAETAALHVQANRTNDEFHAIIHQASGNELLRQLAHDLGHLFPKDYVSRAIRSSSELRAINVDQHERIRSALAAADGRAAGEEMRQHILHARSLVLRYLDEHGFWA